MKYMAPETNKLKMCTHLMPQYQVTRNPCFTWNEHITYWLLVLLDTSKSVAGTLGTHGPGPCLNLMFGRSWRMRGWPFLRNREMFHSNPYCIFTRLYIHASKSMNRIRARPTCDYMSFIHYGNCIPTVIRERRGGGGLHQRECPN